jgi:hypothetical protein
MGVAPTGKPSTVPRGHGVEHGDPAVHAKVFGTRGPAVVCEIDGNLERSLPNYVALNFMERASSR